MNLRAGAKRAVAALIVLLALGGRAVAQPPADLDAYGAGTVVRFGPPGMAVAIVEGDRLYTHVWGVRRLGSPEPVDAHTTFSIGSNTKAFTATAVAMLVDQGKLAWSDHVADRLPGFAMYDPYATREMTVIDLLTHRSGLGLGEGDLMFVPATTRSRADVVHALRYLKPATGFRSAFAYDNVLYPVAGQLIEAVSGQTWETFVKDRIFAPAGMVDAAVSHDGQGPDRVAQHARVSGPVRGVGPLSILTSGQQGGAAGPAGSIYASAADMGAWLRVQLAHGALPGGRRLLSEAASAQLWTPQVVVPITAPPAPVALTEPQFEDYGLGFFIQDYRGHRIITHSGAILGGLSAVAIVPEKNVAFAVMINSEDSGARWSLFYHLLDHYLGLPSPDWPARWQAALDQVHGAALTKTEGARSAQHPERGPSLPLAAYAGVYRDPWYGAATITGSAEGSLRLRFDETPGMEGPLEPVQSDTFRVHWTDRDIEDAYVTFAHDAKGAIARPGP